MSAIRGIYKQELDPQPQGAIRCTLTVVLLKSYLQLKGSAFIEGIRAFCDIRHKSVHRLNT